MPDVTKNNQASYLDPGTRELLTFQTVYVLRLLNILNFRYFLRLFLSIISRYTHHLTMTNSSIISVWSCRKRSWRRWWNNERGIAGRRKEFQTKTGLLCDLYRWNWKGSYKHFCKNLTVMENVFLKFLLSLSN